MDLFSLCYRLVVVLSDSIHDVKASLFIFANNVRCEDLFYLVRRQFVDGKVLRRLEPQRSLARQLIQNPWGLVAYLLKSRDLSRT
jgi:hypothetical protein